MFVGDYPRVKGELHFGRLFLQLITAINLYSYGFKAAKFGFCGFAAIKKSLKIAFSATKSPN
jgi:hypothetical protein